MTVHITATTGCNLGCTYCYETADRERLEGWAQKQYDIEEIMDQLREMKERYPNHTPGLFGGEPLLMKNEHIERILEWINENYDSPPSIQTNGTLIDDEVIEIFKEYNVSPGISVDGPPELNRERKASGEVDSEREEVTDKMSRRTVENIERLVEEEGISVGIIIVLHQRNAGTEERFEKLLDWMDKMAQKGVSGHFNPAIPYDNIQTDISLDPETLKERYLRTWEWVKEEDYRSWNPMETFVDNLLGNSLRNCTNKKCDVFNTGASRMVLGNGETSGCGKAWSQIGDGAKFLQGPSTGNEYQESQERYEILKQVPGGPDKPENAPDLGGCKGCKYWNVCYGGCPSSGINGDYRNRTRWCKANYALYEKIENDLRSLLPNIDLITDLPWNADIYDLQGPNDLDFEPFYAMKPGRDGRTSAHGNFSGERASVIDRVSGELDLEEGFQDKVDRFKSDYGEEVVTVDRESQAIHVDSENPDKPPQTESEGDGWERVEDDD